jgi:succinyl-CoA synthetase beta subunit
VPAFMAPESCTSALAAMLETAQWKEPAARDEDATVAVRIDDLPDGALNEAEAKNLFARFGVPCVRERIVGNAEEAAAAARELGEGKVVLKILSSELTHKSDVGGVAVGIAADRVGERLERMADEVSQRAGVRPQQFLVQEMVQGGVELILGCHRDPLGSAVLLGMGGVTAELLKDTALRMVPPGGLSRDEALSLVRELRTWPLLDGFRGRKLADVDALVSAIVAFSRMIDALGERLVEAEINPVFVLPKGEGVRAADGVAVLARG